MISLKSTTAAAAAALVLACLVHAQIPSTVYPRNTGRDQSGSAQNRGPTATSSRSGDTQGGWRPPSSTARTAAAGPASAIGVRETSTRQQPDSLSGERENTPARGGSQALLDKPAVAPTRARVTSGSGTLPNDKGQVWREYDITPYTARVTSTNRPERGIVDWILRETGYEAWHGETAAVLSADARSLRVYHTPETQAIIGEVVDRFVNSEAETHAFSVRIVSLDSPSWRAKAQRMLRPVNVQTQGVQAWLLAKEDAALLQSELRKRNDFREHSAPHLLVNNGQTAVATAARTQNYVRGVLLTPDAWPGFQPIPGQMDEGYSLELSPLLSLDGRTIDAVVKCHLDQLEKLQPVMLDVATAAAPRQRTQVDVPQLSSFRLHERFRWPTDQVLLIGCGMVAPPVPAEQGLRLPLISAPARVDLLIFVESRGSHGKPPVTAAAPPTIGATVPR
jgi:hypothetical protein